MHPEFRSPAHRSLGAGDRHDGGVRDRRALAGPLPADLHPHRKAHGRLSAATHGASRSRRRSDDRSAPACGDPIHRLWAALRSRPCCSPPSCARTWPSSASPWPGSWGRSWRSAWWPPRAIAERPSSSRWMTTRCSSSVSSWSPPDWWCCCPTDTSSGRSGERRVLRSHPTGHPGSEHARLQQPLRLVLPGPRTPERRSLRTHRLP